MVMQARYGIPGGSARIGIDQGVNYKELIRKIAELMTLPDSAFTGRKSEGGYWIDFGKSWSYRRPPGYTR
jgi:hypothetical protein